MCRESSGAYAEAILRRALPAAVQGRGQVASVAVRREALSIRMEVKDHRLLAVVVAG
ncbi:hypothetical protein Sar04_49110 [Salinispora arenicola]|uniref:Uncharacterized protein n=1 Tax=Salinispora arenicola TaxID=168697 RepID=A0ABQ4JZ26_SALAC|nr:hypothetical protein Sar04_49110 [Salinispora arenicola]